MPPEIRWRPCNGTSLFCGGGHSYFALTIIYLDNIYYVKYETDGK